MYISWVAIAKLDAEIFRNLSSNQYLSVDQNPGFLKPLGITGPRTYQPWLISLQIDVWQEIERRINRDIGGRASGRSQVLEIAERDGEPSRKVVFTVRLYRPNLLVVEVNIRTPFNLSLENGFSIRQMESHPAIRAAVDSIVGVIKSGTTTTYTTGNSFFARPAIRIPVDVSPTQFGIWKESNKNLLANLLINNHLHELSDPALADKIFERNREIDIKFSQSGFALVSKQGVLTAYPSASEAVGRHLENEHLKRFRYLEYALVLREFVSEYATFRQQNEPVADFMLYLGLPFIADAASLPKTVTGTMIWRILSEELGFKVGVEKIDKSLLEALEKKSEVFERINHRDYHTLDFEDKIVRASKRLRKNWLERKYESHKDAFWIVGSVLAAAGVLARVLK